MSTQISIYVNDEIIYIKKSSLFRFKYFRLQFEDEDIKQFTIPDNPFNGHIKNLLLEAEHKYKIQNNITIEDNLKYIQATSYIGIDSRRFINNIINTIKGNPSAVCYINDFDKAGLLKLFALYYQDILCIPYSNFIRSADINEINKDLISKVIPYFTCFDQAFIICDIHNIDFNLITAEPLLKDLFLYENTSFGKTKDVCKIFQHTLIVLCEFLRYFNCVSVNYGDEGINPRKYKFPTSRDFYIKLVADDDEWYQRDEVNINDSDQNIIFYTRGYFTVDKLPIKYDIYDNNYFSLYKGFSQK